MTRQISRRDFLRLMAAAAGTGALGLTACGGSGTQAATTAAATGAALTSTSGKTLKALCTNESYKTLFDKFTAEVGAPVEFVSMSSGEVLSKLKAEGGKPAADLWFGGGIDSFMSAADSGLLEKVDFDRASSFADGFKSPDNYWFSKGATVVGFIVNNDILSEIGAEAPRAGRTSPTPSSRTRS